MTFKKVLIVSVFLIIPVCYFFHAEEPMAQMEKEEPMAQIEERVQLMKSGLNLTQEQTNALRKILSDSVNQPSDSSQQNEKYVFANKHDEEKRRNNINAQIEGILNDEQVVNFRKMLKSINEKDDAELLMLKENLLLTDDQLQSIELIVMSNRPKVEEIKQSTAKDPKEYMRAMNKLMREQAADIEQVLTREQIKEFKKLRKKKEKEMHKNRPKN